mgnify:CR=1 FL=1
MTDECSILDTFAFRLEHIVGTNVRKLNVPKRIYQ